MWIVFSVGEWHEDGFGSAWERFERNNESVEEGEGGKRKRLQRHQRENRQREERTSGPNIYFVSLKPYMKFQF